MPRLSHLVGVTTGLTVAVVAAVVAAILIAAAHSDIDRLAREAVKESAANAKLHLDAIFAEPVAALRAVQRTVEGGAGFALPSHGGVELGARYTALATALYYGMGGREATHLLFNDSSVASVAAHDGVVVAYAAMSPAPGTPRNRSAFAVSLQAWRQADRGPAAVPAEVAGDEHFDELTAPESLLRADAARLYAPGGAPEGGVVVAELFFTEAHGSDVDGHGDEHRRRQAEAPHSRRSGEHEDEHHEEEATTDVSIEIPLHARLRNQSGALIGAALSTVHFSDVSHALRATRNTPNSVRIVLDGDGRLLLATHAEPVVDIFAGLTDAEIAAGGYASRPGCRVMAGHHEEEGEEHHDGDDDHAAGGNSTAATANTTAQHDDGDEDDHHEGEEEHHEEEEETRSVVCRRSLTESRWAPARDLRPDALPADGSAATVELAGTRYYAARVDATPAGTVGRQFIVVALTPESDLLADVERSTLVASLIAAAVLVVGVAVSVGVVAWLLAPLPPLAERLATAAELRDDDSIANEDGSSSSGSCVAEVARLEEAYGTLTAELKRLRSYIPDTVLAGLYGSSGEEDENEDDEDAKAAGSRADSYSARRSSVGTLSRSRGETSTDDTRSVRSTRSSLRRGGAAAASSAGAAGGATALNLAVGLSERRCTVLMLNTEGFNQRLRAKGQLHASDIAESYSVFITGVLSAVHDQRGVLDSFHGDRVMASFNAARPIAAAGRRAVACAMALRGVAADALGLTAHVGVASGSCRVGNVGAATAKRFCVFGAAVTRAAALCAAGPEYAEDAALLTEALAKSMCCEPDRQCVTKATVLAAGSLRNELEGLCVSRTVDARRLGRTDAGLTAVVLVLRLVADREAAAEEWLYTVGAGGDDRDGGGSNTAAFEQAFTALSSGGQDVPELNSAHERLLALPTGSLSAVDARLQARLKAISAL